MGDDRHRTAPTALGSAWLTAAGAVAPWLPAGLAGALAGLALPPLGAPLLLWPALAVLWDLAGDPPAPGRGDGRRPPGAGLVWGLMAVLVSHRWLLWLHPLDWVGVPLPLSLPVCLLLWLACGLLAGVLVQLWLLLVRRADPRRPGTVLAAAALWGLAEVGLARGPLFWIGLGGSALPGDRPLAGLAALGGAGLVAATQLLLGWCLWRLLRDRGGWRGWLALGVGLLLAAHGLGLAALLAVERSEAGGTGAAAAREERLLVLQPAIPTREKFEAAQQRRLLGQLAAAQQWLARQPERTAISGLLLPEGALVLDQPLPEVATVEVLSGGFRRQEAELRSSLLRFPPGSRVPVAWIDKHRLVPLGEWVPLASLWRWSGLSAVGGIEPGPPSRLLWRPAGAVGVAICYELADGAALARASRDGARWLLASANLDPYPPLLQQQFVALARLRSIETGRWLVSAANTGPSLAVDGAGRLRQMLPPGRPAEAVIRLQPRTALTPYARWGEGPLLVLLSLAAGWRLLALRTRRPAGRQLSG